MENELIYKKKQKGKSKVRGNRGWLRTSFVSNLVNGATPTERD